MSWASVDLSAAGDSTIVAGVAGRRIVVLKYVLHGVGGANVVRFKGSTTGNLWGRINVPGGGGVGESFLGGDRGLFDVKPGEGLVLNCSAATELGGRVNYEYRD